jgi:hypothetical protein
LFDHEVFGADAPVDPNRWVFHYTKLGNARVIASTQSFRLGAMATMNDPREYQAAEPVTMRTSPSRGLTRDEVDAAIRAFVGRRLEMRVASFTADAALGSPQSVARAAGRGYTRPSLWAHYADRHRGVCLVLDRAEFTRLLDATFADHFVNGEVDYVDGVDPDDWSGILDLDDVARRGIDTAVGDHLRTHLIRLAFTKNADWSPEREWRCCVLDQPAGGHVEVGLLPGVVTGVVLGLDFPETDLDDMREIADRFAIRPNVARTYVHQLNMIDVLPVDTTGASWRYYSRSELQTLGYL